MKRAVHVVCMALNFIHGDLRHVPLVYLGRSPNLAQRRVFRRIRALLTASDVPGEHPLPPGRSGFEFIARITELEHFAEAHNFLNPDPYSGATEDGPLPLKRIGKIKSEHQFRTTNEVTPINPYRNLCADRLKIVGTGSWDMSEFLDDILWLPFLEPKILKHGLTCDWPGPNFALEKKEEYEKLLKIWDSRGLLALFADGPADGLLCRVFNAHKNSSVDRQIGDRRLVNGSELHPRGPSAFLPGGPNMTSLHCPKGYKLVGCASDRKDFYHQARVSRERAFSNSVPFLFDVETFRETKAFAELVDEVQAPTTRSLHGDRLGLPQRKPIRGDQIKKVTAGFKSLFQGDHLGVEYALSSHTALLQRGGLLVEESHVLRHRPFPTGPVWQGLVIDDFFVVSKEPRNSFAPSKASKILDTAEAIYHEHEVLGSDDKTIRDESNFKIIGAEVISDERALGAGVVTVGAPVSKRTALAALTLEVAQLPVISRSLASRLAGNWISTLMFRRSCTCILSDIFALGTRSIDDSNDVLPLSRKVADELVLASIFGLVAVTDVSVPYGTKLYATDASMSRGAVVSKQISQDLSELLWLGGDRKGSYTLLENPARCMRKAVFGLDFEDEDSHENLQDPPKFLDFAFDCVEICGGSGVLSEALGTKCLYSNRSVQQ